MEYEVKSLRSLTNLITKGTTPSNIGETFTDEGVMYFRSELVGRGKYIDKSSGLLFISEETHKKLKRSQIKSGDLLFSMAGAYLGKISLVSDEDVPSNTNQAVAIVRFKPGSCNVEYAYYFMTQKWFTDYVYSFNAQAAQPNINLEQIGKLKIVLPSLHLQNRVVAILSAYDRLIATNNKRIKVLEQMAENLYKEWFVRFRFPGHKTAEFVDSKMGRIPSSFSIIKMGDAFDYYIGGGWGNDEADKDFSVEAYVIRGTDFPRVARGDVSSCPLRYHKRNNYSVRALQADDIVLEVSGGTPEQPVGRALLVNEEVLERLGNKVICASFCKQVRVNKNIVSPIYFYYWMKFLYETRVIDRFQLQSTGIINFQFEYFLRKGEIMLPEKEIMCAFDKEVRLMHKEIASLARQNENLVRQRDFLLPRLMSGKLEA